MFSPVAISQFSKKISIKEEKTKTAKTLAIYKRFEKQKC